MTDSYPIYLATVLLEKNRWNSREPSFKVSDWAQRIVDAGFDGIELWENHLLLADRAEWDALRNGPVSVPILNTYCGFDDDSADARSASAELARHLDVGAVKFNFGNDPAQVDAYRRNLMAWRDELPDGCRLLCECHANTVLEDLDKAPTVLAPIMDQVEIIVHGFVGDDETDLVQRIECFGSAITHVHSVLTEKGCAPRRVEILKDAGFSGTFSIEFCYGVIENVQDVKQLLATATEDLNYLRKELA